jgi:hypothetical protein
MDWIKSCFFVSLNSATRGVSPWADKKLPNDTHFLKVNIVNVANEYPKTQQQPAIPPASRQTELLSDEQFDNLSKITDDEELTSKVMELAEKRLSPIDYRRLIKFAKGIKLNKEKTAALTALTLPDDVGADNCLYIFDAAREIDDPDLQARVLCGVAYRIDLLSSGKNGQLERFIDNVAKLPAETFDSFINELLEAGVNALSALYYLAVYKCKLTDSQRERLEKKAPIIHQLLDSLESASPRVSSKMVADTNLNNR